MLLEISLKKNKQCTLKIGDFFWKKQKCISVRLMQLLGKDDVKVFRKEIISVRKDIHIFGPLKEYIQEVFRKAYINKASRIYEHGISRAETAGLLGVTQWELAEIRSHPSYN